jgi:hypothetical protein
MAETIFTSPYGSSRRAERGELKVSKRYPDPVGFLRRRSLRPDRVVDIGELDGVYFLRTGNNEVFHLEPFGSQGFQLLRSAAPLAHNEPTPLTATTLTDAIAEVNVFLEHRYPYLERLAGPQPNSLHFNRLRAPNGELLALYHSGKEWRVYELSGKQASLDHRAIEMAIESGQVEPALTLETSFPAEALAAYDQGLSQAAPAVAGPKPAISTLASTPDVTQVPDAPTPEL